MAMLTPVLCTRSAVISTSVGPLLGPLLLPSLLFDEFLSLGLLLELTFMLHEEPLLDENSLIS